MQVRILMLLLSITTIPACFFEPLATPPPAETETDLTAPTDSSEETGVLDTTGVESGATDEPTETGSCPAAVFDQSAFGGSCFG